MNSAQLDIILNLVAEIKKLDEVISLHSGDAFMQNQYRRRKDKFVGTLIDKLVDQHLFSVDSVLVIKDLIERFYKDDIQNHPRPTDHSLSVISASIR